MDTQQKERRFGKWANILVVASVILSTASVVWTTYSVLDLLSVGVIAITVAATLDLAWISIQYAQHQGIPLMGSHKATIYAGWLSIVFVVVLLVWHGLSLEGQYIAGQYIDGQNALAIAIASPLLPISAKFVMMLAAARFHDPTQLTIDQQEQIDELRRNRLFQLKQGEQDEAQRKAVHDAWLKEEEEQREKDRAEAKSAREKSLVAHQNRMAQLEQEQAEREALAKNQLAALQSKNARDMEEARLNAQLQIDNIRNAAEIEMVKATEFGDIDIARAEKQEELRRRLPMIISQPATIQQPELEPMRPTYPATSRRIVSATVEVDSLSPARQAKKRLAAAWYLSAEEAAKRGEHLSQAQFARDNDINQVEVSRALKLFSREEALRDAS